MDAKWYGGMDPFPYTPSRKDSLGVAYGEAIAKAAQQVDTAKAVLTTERSFPDPGYLVASSTATQAELERRELQKVGAIPVDSYTRLPEVPIQTQVIRMKIDAEKVFKALAETDRGLISRSGVLQRMVIAQADEITQLKSHLLDIEARLKPAKKTRKGRAKHA